MKQINLLTSLILLIISLPALAQGTSNTNEKTPYIEVTGTAEKEIIPDEIYISITIRERQEGKEKITIEKQEMDLKKALVSLSLSLDNLSLSNANADYMKVSWTKKDVITKKEYVLKVENATTVGNVFEKLKELKILDAYISEVSHSKIIEYKKEVRIMAIKAAKEKADYLLGAIDQQTGSALIVNEINHKNSNYNTNLNIRGGRSSESNYFIDGVKVRDSEKKIIQFKKIKLQAAIYVKFAIK